MVLTPAYKSQHPNFSIETKKMRDSGLKMMIDLLSGFPINLSVKAEYLNNN